MPLHLCTSRRPHHSIQLTQSLKALNDLLWEHQEQRIGKNGMFLIRLTGHVIGGFSSGENENKSAESRNLAQHGDL